MPWDTTLPFRDSNSLHRQKCFEDRSSNELINPVPLVWRCSVMLNPKVCWTSGRSPQLVRTKRKIQFLTNLNTGVEVFMADWGGGGRSGRGAGSENHPGSGEEI